MIYNIDKKKWYILFVQAKQRVKNLDAFNNSKVLTFCTKLDIIQSKFGSENVICLRKDANMQKFPIDAQYVKSVIYLGQRTIIRFFGPQFRLPVDWTFDSIL